METKKNLVNEVRHLHRKARNLVHSIVGLICSKCWKAIPVVVIAVVVFFAFVDVVVVVML